MNLCLSRARAATLSGVLALAATVLTFSPASADSPKPSVPLNVDAVQEAADSVTVTWDPPSYEGSSAIAGYVVTYSTGQSGNGIETDSTARSAHFELMDPGHYTFSVIAKNADDESSSPATVAMTVVGAAPSLRSSVSSLTAGSAMTLSGVWSSGESVVLQRRLPGGAWTGIKTVTADADGDFGYRSAVTRTAVYRARPIDAQDSGETKVVARNKVSIAASRSTRRTYTLHGTVGPGLSRQVVKLYAARGTGYSLLASVRTTSSGRYSYTRHYAATATYSFKAVTAGSSLNSAGTAVRRVAVH